MTWCRFCSVIVAVLVLFMFDFSVAAEWNYENVEHWADYFPICGSNEQSPIDLVPTTTFYDSTLASIQFINYNTSDQFTQFDILNNGHTVVVNIRNVSQSIGIHGGALTNNFTLEQFHFHWGHKTDVGSEHQINGVSYPKELHLVHFNSDKYHNVSDAANHTDGLAVLGIFIQVTDEDNVDFEKIVKNFELIRFKEEEEKNIERFPMRSMLPSNTGEFYRYRGSLTTPPCFQSVQWTVFRHPVLVSHRQLEAFQALYENATEHEMANNRSTQPLNKRNVTRSFESINVEWGYGTEDGPSEWKKLIPQCGLLAQSPVDIVTSAVHNVPLGLLSFGGPQTATPYFNLFNTGKAVELSVGNGWTLSGGGLNGGYKLDKIVFHWGKDDSTGSEHTVNGEPAGPLEMQFVYYNSSYDNSMDASIHKGLAIVVVFAQIAVSTSSPALTNVTAALSEITQPGNVTKMSSFDVTDLLPVDRTAFYRYNGSVTSPSCDEGVVWSVYADTINITSAEMAVFRSVNIAGVKPVTPSSNCRPVQPLNGRVISRNTVGQPATATQLLAPALNYLLPIIALLMSATTSSIFVLITRH